MREDHAKDAIIHIEKLSKSFQDGDQIREALRSWRSPASNAEYPAGWILTVPDQNLELEVQPVFADQEMNVSYVYWEGTVNITGWNQGKPLSG